MRINQNGPLGVPNSALNGKRRWWLAGEMTDSASGTLPPGSRNVFSLISLGSEEQLLGIGCAQERILPRVSFRERQVDAINTRPSSTTRDQQRLGATSVAGGSGVLLDGGKS
jgi:hypothetical protein